MNTQHASVICWYHVNNTDLRAINIDIFIVLFVEYCFVNNFDLVNKTDHQSTQSPVQLAGLDKLVARKDLKNFNFIPVVFNGFHWL